MSILDPNPGPSLTITVDTDWLRKRNRWILIDAFISAMMFSTIAIPIFGSVNDTIGDKIVRHLLTFVVLLPITFLLSRPEARANLRTHLQRTLEKKLEYDDVKLNKVMTEFTATNTFGVEESEETLVVTLTGRLVRINAQAYEVLFDK